MNGKIPKHCEYQQFIHLFPMGYRPTLKVLLQQSRRGRFPSYTRIGGQKNPPLFEREAIIQYAKDQFSLFFPNDVSAIEKALIK